MTGRKEELLRDTEKLSSVHLLCLTASVDINGSVLTRMV
jgi:hypothetical protein